MRYSPSALGGGGIISSPFGELFERECNKVRKRGERWEKGDKEVKGKRNEKYGYGGQKKMT